MVLKQNEYLGILGGGQLGRMLALAATQLGIKTIIFSDIDDCPAKQFADEFLCGSYQDAGLLDSFSRKATVITYEFENIPLSVIDYLQSRTALYPKRDILSVTQDRLSEKTFVKTLGIPVADFSAVSYEGDIKAYLQKKGTEAILKTRRMGYDGKGQLSIASSAQAAQIYYDLKEVPAVIEEKIDFIAEFSVIAVRTIAGDFHHFDIPENVHQSGILKTSSVPSSLSDAVQQQAITYTKKISDSLGYVGVLTVEYFLKQDGTVVVNEIAPRVHNSGHWTLDACYTNQFEQHVRAVCGWTLGSFHRHSHVVMHNLIGEDVNHMQHHLDNPDCKIHLYGKPEARVGRKMGHMNILQAK